MKTVCELGRNDLDKWDAFVQNHPLGSIYHLSGWKEALEGSFKHIRGDLVVVRDGATGGIVAGLPVYEVDSWITGRRLVCAPFANFCEPLLTAPDDGELLAGYLAERYGPGKPAFIEVKSRAPVASLIEAGYGTSMHYLHHVLRLDTPPEQLFERFHKKSVRAAILNADKCGLGLRIAENEQDLSLFYRINLGARKRIGLPSVPYKFFQMLWEVFHPSGKLHLILCMLKDKPVGASLLLKFKEWTLIEYGHDVIEFRRMNVNHFLDWEAIKLAHQEGSKFVSFGRSYYSHTGLITYKSRWATEVEPLVTHVYPESSGAAGGKKDASWKRRLVKGICKASPMPLYKMINAVIYRHHG